MNINGKAKIWAKEYSGANGTYKRYSMSVSSKNEDGSYNNGYFPIRFKKGVEVENGSTINVTNGFLALNVYKDKNGNEVKSVIGIITEFENDSDDDLTPVNDGDLPF